MGVMEGTGGGGGASSGLSLSLIPSQRNKQKARAAPLRVAFALLRTVLGRHPSCGGHALFAQRAGDKQRPPPMGSLGTRRLAIPMWPLLATMHREQKRMGRVP